MYSYNIILNKQNYNNIYEDNHKLQINYIVNELSIIIVFFNAKNNRFILCIILNLECFQIIPRKSVGNNMITYNIIGRYAIVMYAEFEI